MAKSKVGSAWTGTIGGILMALVVTLLLASLFSAPSIGSSSVPAAAPTPVAPHAAPVAPVEKVAMGSTLPPLPHPALTFPRTVLIETFTAVWCPHCPAETEALYGFDQNTSHSDLAIAELHVCYYPPGEGPCDDNYVPPDNTSSERGAFYDVCGYPDVFFDGQHNACGASDSEPQMAAEYASAIHNASAYPGNVSISQNSWVSAGNVTDWTNITSGITGSYNVVTYLLQYINKTNVNIGSGPHDLANVVRETLQNHPVNLTAGQTTELYARGPTLNTWNDLNFSVITLVQQNSTKIVENSNMAPVSTLRAAVVVNPTALSSNQETNLTVTVVNSTTGDTLSDANVTLTSSGGGSFSPASGQTNLDGQFLSTYTAPTVSSVESINLSADVTEGGYAGQVAVGAITVDPLIAPTVPLNLAESVGIQSASLSWNAPSTGSGGVTYYLYRATASTGPFSEIATTTQTSYIDTDLPGTGTYWYQIAAQDVGGFSGNTTTITATSVALTPQGLPAGIGWWINVDGQNFTLPDNASISVYLPAGSISYTFGSGSYGYLGGAAAGPLVVGTTPVNLPLTFTPRYATLDGTVSPVSAAVTVDGVAIPVTSGKFSLQLVAGPHTVNVSASGYVSSSNSVILTPGNTTSQTFTLTATSSTGNTGNGGSTISPSSSGLSSTDELWIFAAVAVGVAALLIGLLMMPKKGTRRSGP